MEPTKNRIITYIEEHKQATPKELVAFLGISSRAVFKQLSSLVSDKKLQKIGRSPKVFYKIFVDSTIAESFRDISPSAQRIISSEFITITPEGKYLKGMEAFIQWCNSRGFNIESKAIEYEQVYKKYQPLKKDGYIDGTEKFFRTYEKVWIDEVYYLDFYSVEIFGKTKLGQKLLYAKQSQDKKIIDELIEEISPRIIQLINAKYIDCVGFIPPTVKREVQLMREFEKILPFDKSKLKIVKTKTEITVPQKTLSKLDDRIINANNTLIVDDNKKYNNILLIDDAVGSGATFNQVAKSIKEKGLVSGKVIGLAITGSLKGFDVISEV